MNSVHILISRQMMFVVCLRIFHVFANFHSWLDR